MSPQSTSDADLLERLGRYPEEVRRAVAGRRPDEMRRAGSDGGWGVVEHLAHLLDWERVFADRVGAVLANDRPELPAFDDALWSIENDYPSQESERVLGEFSGLRRGTVSHVGQLPPEAWEREGVHGIAGPVTLRWLLERLDDHGQEHLRQIRDILA